MKLGHHKHKCACGAIWQHGDECFDNVDAHRCPDCGRMVTMQYSGDETMNVSHPVSHCVMSPEDAKYLADREKILATKDPVKIFAFMLLGLGPDDLMD